MRTYKQIHFSKVASILTLVAQGVSCVSGHDYPTSDMVYAMEHLFSTIDKECKEFYFAIRDMGTEHGTIKDCIARCECLGYPIIIAKVTADPVVDYNLTITYTKHWWNGTGHELREEFKKLSEV